RKALKEWAEIQTATYGEKDWRVTDARLELAYLEQRSRLDPEQRRRLLEGRRQYQEAVKLREQQKLSEAVSLLQRSLQAYQQALGVEHHACANILGNLGQLYWAQGKYARAEPPLQRAVEIQKQALGEKHPGYAAALNNLALLYTYQGDYPR